MRLFKFLFVFGLAVLAGTQSHAEVKIEEKKRKINRKQNNKKGFKKNPNKARAQKAKAKAKPVVEADDGDEPEVRKAASKTAAAVPEKKSKLSSIVGEWDDE